MVLNVHLAFFIFFSLSVLSPKFGIEYINILMVCLTLSLLGVYSLVLLLKNNRYKSFFVQYKTEIVLICAYTVVSLTSVLVKIEVFEGSIFDLAFYGLSPIVIWISMPLFWFVLRYSVNDKPHYFWAFGWSVFVLLALVGLWQVIDFQSAKVITHYFVAGSRLEPNDGNISSLTRISTDYGVIMAFAFICSIISWNRTAYLGWKKIYVFLALLFFIAGIFSFSRNFLVTVIIGGVLLGFENFKKNWRFIVALGIFFFAVLNVIVISTPQVGERFALLFPYMAKLSTGEQIIWRDFLFIFNEGDIDTSGRGIIWRFVFISWMENFFFGISHRAFNIELALAFPGMASITTSAHNILLQSIVDGGVFGLVIILTLIYRIHRHCSRKGTSIIFWVVLMSMMVDYYLDHSLPWIICAAWCLNIFHYQRFSKKTSEPLSESGFGSS